MLILSCLNFLVQSYDALEQETTISQFIVSFTCGGYMIFATDNEYFDIIVAVKWHFRFLFLSRTGVNTITRLT